MATNLTIHAGQRTTPVIGMQIMLREKEARSAKLTYYLARLRGGYFAMLENTDN
ncbi:hypothetical protein LGN17_18000 [Burkholderia sp. AU30280]|uniref:hypothetical protein n=1 Tax=Burkholderia sp. AU30280 TaxID=2879628 RepID=UPI001CF1275E|nr:hypothetical protein [Burkholderia sp. AU30280]MCA8274385.1 hypothetical protein [Burkholderia sp. AU30280]